MAVEPAAAVDDAAAVAAVDGAAAAVDGAAAAAAVDGAAVAVADIAAAADGIVDIVADAFAFAVAQSPDRKMCFENATAATVVCQSVH